MQITWGRHHLYITTLRREGDLTWNWTRVPLWIFRKKNLAPHWQHHQTSSSQKKKGGDEQSEDLKLSMDEPASLESSYLPMIYYLYQWLPHLPPHWIQTTQKQSHDSVGKYCQQNEHLWSGQPTKYHLQLHLGDPRMKVKKEQGDWSFPKQKNVFQ